MIFNANNGDVATIFVVEEKFYANFPDNEVKHLIKTLVWDAIGIETFAWSCFDKLKLNEPYQPSEFSDLIIKMGEWGALKMKGLKLVWSGISRMNGEICALIQYKSLCNPVTSNANNMTINGRSLYWGGIWISLQDKQIEYATMNEDVMMEMNMPGASQKNLLNMQREVIFVRSN